MQNPSPPSQPWYGFNQVPQYPDPPSLEDFYASSSPYLATAPDRVQPFQESLFLQQDQTPLDHIFSNLFLSSPARPNVALRNGGGVDALPHISLADLQSLRVQYAVMGQTHEAPQEQPPPFYYRRHRDSAAPSFPPSVDHRLGLTPDLEFRNYNYRDMESSLFNGFSTARTHQSRHLRPRMNGFQREESFRAHINDQRHSSSLLRNPSTSRNGVPRASSSSGFRTRTNYNNSSSSSGSGSRGRVPSPCAQSRARPSYGSLEEIKGRMFDVARDQQGCRFLEKKLEEGKAEDVEMIFSELKSQFDELVRDSLGSHVVQRLFETCNEEQISDALRSLVKEDKNLLAICKDQHGTRVMQKLMEHLTTIDQKSQLLQALGPLTVSLTRDSHGNHVINHCLKLFSADETEVVLNEVADNCYEVATDKSGCCVLQQCINHAQGETRERLIAEVVTNALLLSQHSYGNYVVQYIVGGLRIPFIAERIHRTLAGKYVLLSTNKFGSNVVEKCLKESSQKHVDKILAEILSSPNFLMVLQDQYGNFVAQSALSVAKEPTRTDMVQLIEINSRYLHSHPFGKRVLECARGGNKHHRPQNHTM